MQQLTVTGKGRVVLREVPDPGCNEVGVLAETHYAFVSSGTEAAILRQHRMSALDKLLAIDGLFRKAVKYTLEGRLWHEVRRTWGNLRAKPQRSPFYTLPPGLGYSSAGVAVEVGAEVEGIRPGDRVAYAGAPHASMAYAPRNLVVKVPAGVSLKAAASVAVGAIALQGVRRADPQFGETFVVIGMGLIGQLTAQMLKACGCRVVACDLLASRLQLAEELGADAAVLAEREPVAAVLRYTNYLGADGVIVCAYSKTPKPLVQAFEMTRLHGRVVLVGDVRMDLPRPPMFQKEIDFFISSGRGPGMFQPEYEVEGLDYPCAEVRWTERRNMEEYLRLISSGAVKVERLITHVFPAGEAQVAYEQLLERPQSTLGVVLQFASGKAEAGAAREKERPTAPFVGPKEAACPKVRTGFIGCGNFAKYVLIPHMRQVGSFALECVATSSRHSAEAAKAELGFARAFADYRRVLEADVELVVVATRHNLHARLAVEALEAGKHVFVEKPLGLTVAECQAVVETAERCGRLVTVGFNRRFSPLVARMRRLLSGVENPIMVQYRAVRNFLPAEHWVFDPAQGGGRILGEAVHFFDLMYWLVGAEPRRVFAWGGNLSHPGHNVEDNVVVGIEFADRSLGALTYGDLGDAGLAFERVEVFAGGMSMVLDGFQELAVFGRAEPRLRLPRPEMGFYEELESFSRAILEGGEPVVSAEDGLRATLVACRVLEALREGKPVEVAS